MGFLEIFLLAVGLAMDAFSVSIYKGVKEGRINLKLCLALGLTFGIFQGLMPLFGYIFTSIEFLKVLIQEYSKYIIFLLLLFIGGKMLIDAIKEGKEEKVIEEEQTNKLDLKEIFVLGIATSIDALSVGITFTGEGMVMLEVLVAVLVIAVVSFVFSFFGGMFGKVLSKYIKNYAGIFGGVVLILIGLKVLLGL